MEYIDIQIFLVILFATLSFVAVTLLTRRSWQDVQKSEYDIQKDREPYKRELSCIAKDFASLVTGGNGIARIRLERLCECDSCFHKTECHYCKMLKEIDDKQ